MKKKKAILFGALGGVIASMCCWGPLLLISLGLISTSGALSIGYRSPWFIGVGIAFTVIIVAYYLWKNLAKSCSTKKEFWIKQILITLAIIAAMILTTFLLKDVLVPYIAPYVYK